MKLNVKINGLKGVLDMLDPTEYEAEASKVVEKHARLQANKSADRAPVDTGLLSNSIQSSPREIDSLTWQWGSNVEYAQRQEYEHKTKKGFVRKTVFEGRQPFRDDLQKVVRRLSQ